MTLTEEATWERKRRQPTATSVEAIPAEGELAALRAKIERGEAQLDALTRELTQPQPNGQAHAPAPVPDVDAPLARDPLSGRRFLLFLIAVILLMVAGEAIVEVMTPSAPSPTSSMPRGRSCSRFLRIAPKPTTSTPSRWR
jgi:hypothetical protein